MKPKDTVVDATHASDPVSEAIKLLFRGGLATMTPTGEIILTARGWSKVK